VVYSLDPGLDRCTAVHYRDLYRHAVYFADLPTGFTLLPLNLRWSLLLYIDELLFSYSLLRFTAVYIPLRFNDLHVDHLTVVILIDLLKFDFNCYYVAQFFGLFELIQVFLLLFQA